MFDLGEERQQALANRLRDFGVPLNNQRAQHPHVTGPLGCDHANFCQMAAQAVEQLGALRN